MPDQEHLGQLFSGLSDAELRRIWRTELVSEARAVLQEEMMRRGVTAPELSEPARTEPVARTKPSIFSNPYLPPGALLADPKSEAVLSARGLVRLFQRLVVASTFIGIVLWSWIWLPLPISDDAMALRNVSGADAFDPMTSWLIITALQPVFIVCALGLYFFKWWARWLFVGAYGVGCLNTFLGGMGVSFGWEGALYQIMTLMDGAIIALAFLPPLAGYFEADRTTT
jgi:hypothetical protein